MDFLITFLEGMITFVSPCVLPLLPVYAAYFAGGSAETTRRRTLGHALGFTAGFTAVFMLLGLLASSLAGWLVRRRTLVDLVTGAVVVVLGLHYAGLIRIGFLQRTVKPETSLRPTNFGLSVLFGAVFAVGWSPCTGAFLGSAMLLAAQQASWLRGMLLLAAYSAGLGVPFVLCAVLLQSLSGAFAWIRRHYRVINLVCGVFLMAVGVLMMTGLFARLTASLS